jgi:hypothetical protein
MTTEVYERPGAPLEPAGVAESTAGNWPATRLAWYAVFILACVLMFGTIENGIITYLIHPIKRDFGLTDLQMSVLIGAASGATCC